MSAAIKPAKAEDSGPIVNSNGMTPLMNAVCDDSIDLVRTLLDSGVDINAKRDDGFTALTLAAFFGRTEIVELLLQRGADIHTKTRFGTSPLMWATARGFPKIVDLLNKAAEHAVAAECAASAEQKTHRESKARAAKILPEPVDPLPIVAEAFHPSQVFVDRVISSPKKLASLAAVIIAVLGLGIFATSRISRTLSDKTSQPLVTVKELKVEPEAPVVQAAQQEPDLQELEEPSQPPVHSNHTVKPSVKSFSTPIAARWSVSRQRDDSFARESTVKRQDESEGDSKPAPLTVEVTREPRTDPVPSRNTDETPRAQPAPLGITSDKPKTKVIQWP